MTNYISIVVKFCNSLVKTIYVNFTHSCKLGCNLPETARCQTCPRYCRNSTSSNSEGIQPYTKNSLMADQRTDK